MTLINIIVRVIECDGSDIPNHGYPGFLKAAGITSGRKFNTAAV